MKFVDFGKKYLTKNSIDFIGVIIVAVDYFTKADSKISFIKVNFTIDFMVDFTTVDFIKANCL